MNSHVDVPNKRESVRLRPREYGEVYSLVERCLAVGNDPYAWRLQCAFGLKDVFDAEWAYIGEQKIVGPVGTPGWFLPYSLIDTGFASTDQEAVFLEWIQYGKPEKNPMVELWMTPDWFVNRRLCVMPRSMFIDDQTWYASEFYNRFSKRVGFDDVMASGYRFDSGAFYWLVVQRRSSQPFYIPRDRRRLAVLTHLLAGHIGNRLTETSDDGVLQMPRRQREVLAGLLEGNSDKQVAANLEISIHTVKQYIQRIHKRLRVNSRGELLARTRYLTAALQGSIQTTELDHDRRLRRAIREWCPTDD